MLNTYILSYYTSFIKQLTSSADTRVCLWIMYSQQGIDWTAARCTSNRTSKAATLPLQLHAAAPG